MGTSESCRLMTIESVLYIEQNTSLCRIATVQALAEKLHKRRVIT